MIYRWISAPLAYLVLFLVIYALLWVFTGDAAKPPKCEAYKRIGDGANQNPPVAFCYGGTSLNVIIVYSVAFLCGQLMEMIRLPGLLGELFLDLLAHFEKQPRDIFSDNFGRTCSVCHLRIRAKEV